MNSTPRFILDAIGNTPIVELSRVVPPGSARILAKIEWLNPTGSMKDRMALSIIEAAAAGGATGSGWTAVLSGGPTGSHKIEGIGIGFIPPLWKPDEVDEIIPVTTSDAKETTRRLAREEGLFAGTSSGANVVAALQVAKRLGPDATVVTVMIDSGLRYMSTDLYAPPA